MTDVTVTETNTIPSENYVSSFFSKLPTDSRFVRVAYQQVVPFTAIDKTSDKIQFLFDTLKSPMCYLLSDMLISATVVITKADRVAMPDVTANVGPINCAISSLFESCFMKINDIPITEAGDFYPYRNYLSQVITYDSDAKITQLLAGGYLNDTVTEDDARNIEPSANQNGWVERSIWFRKNRKSEGAYKPEGVTFLGSFKHELSGNEKPIPPGVKICFDLQRSSDAFYLMRGKTSTDPVVADTNEYKANLLKCCLFVKIAQMVEPIYKSLISKFEKQPLVYHYRKVTCKAYAIPPEGQIFSSQNLYPENEAPVKIHFVIVETTSFRGDYSKNPFGFYRKWVQIAAVAPHESEIFTRYMDTEVQNQVKHLEQQLEDQRAAASAQKEALTNQLRQIRQEQRKSRKKQEKRQKATEKLQKELLEAFKKSVQPSVSTVQSTSQSTFGSLFGSAGANNETVLPNVNPPSSLSSEKQKKHKKNSKSKKENSNSEEDPDYNPNEESSTDSDTSSDSDTNSENQSVTESETPYVSAKSDDSHKSKKQKISVFSDCPPQNVPTFNFSYNNVGAPGDIVYVQELSLKINGDQLDQLNMRSTEDESIFDYVRMQNTNGFINHTASNNISYNAFLHGFYICAFDLSTTNTGANSNYSIPSMRQGNLSVQIYFSKPPGLNLTLLMFGESTAVMTIPHDGKVTKTYLPYKQD